jgi:hypothetical protein
MSIFREDRGDTLVGGQHELSLGLFIILHNTHYSHIGISRLPIEEHGLLMESAACEPSSASFNFLEQP